MASLAAEVAAAVAPPLLTTDAANAALTAASAAQSSPSSSPPAIRDGGRKRKFVHTNEAQRRSMLEWLECPDNFTLLTSRSGATGVKQPNGKKMKKTDGFRALMRHVNASSGANWTMDVAKSRFESFLTSYRKVKAQSQQPGFELTENDHSRGITDMHQKLNVLCMFYDRIDALYNPKPSVDVIDVVEPGDQSVSESVDLNLQGGQHDPESSHCHEAPLAMEVSSSTNVETIETIEAEDKPDAPAAETDTSPIAPPPTEHHSTGVDSHTGRIVESPLTSSQSSSVSLSDDVALRQLAVERERLNILQQQLAVQKRELDLRERELEQKEQQRHFQMRTELAAKLIQAGKSVAEVKEILELLA